MYIPRDAKIKNFIVVSQDCADTRKKLQQIYLKCKIQKFHGNILKKLWLIPHIINVNFMYDNLL
jgi:hypothetical protein